MVKFRTEAELCAAYAGCVPDNWTIYNETAGFDMLLVHETGFQIGVEAKMKLNPKVVLQAADTGYRSGTGSGPDARAVLVPALSGQSHELASICALLGITVIEVAHRRRLPSVYGRNNSKEWSAKPKLPTPQKMSDRWTRDRNWYDIGPEERCELPEYVPDVQAGVSSPVILGPWKIKAIKVCVFVEKRKNITRRQFRKLDISPSRWMDGIWLQKGGTKGKWIAGPHFPADKYRSMHPVVYEKIEADFHKWSAELEAE